MPNTTPKIIVTLFISLLLMSLILLFLHRPNYPDQQQDSPRQTIIDEHVPASLQTSDLVRRSTPADVVLGATNLAPDPRSWRDATILAETIETSESNEDGFYLRHRIIDDDSFRFPIRITDAMEYDQNGEEQKITEISAYVANQILLHSPTPLVANEIEDIANSLGWRYLKPEGTKHLAVLETDEIDLNIVEEAIGSILLSGSPLSAEPNHIFYSAVAPNDPRFTSNDQWALNNDLDFDIDAPEGWDIRSSASSVTIAIVDTGIRLDHEDLSANLWKNNGDPTNNGIDDDNNGYIDDVHGYNAITPSKNPEDNNGHGTHVAGISGAASNNNKGIAGVAWDVKLMTIKVLNADGKGATSTIAKGLEYAIENGANIINASWGSDSFSATIEESITRAKNEGILFVAAAGNDGNEAPSYPGSSQQPNVITVGSVNESNARSNFSNYSPTAVDVMAPGENVLSTWHSTTDAYSKQNGTSMAAPMVSGLLALTLAQYPNDDYETQRQRIIASSEKVEDLKFTSISGGIVNVFNALMMEHVPDPPVLLETSEKRLEIYEGQNLSMWATAESGLPLTYKWRHNDILLAESSPTLSFETAGAERSGKYALDIINQDATISVVFEITVHPRFTDIENLIGNGVIVFGSHIDHWELIEEEGRIMITHKSLPKGTRAFLEFRVSKPGLLRVVGKRQEGSSNQYRTMIYGPEVYRSIYKTDWETIDITTEAEAGFKTTIEHSNEYYPGSADPRTLSLEIPRFYEPDKLPPVFRERLSSWPYAIGKTANFQVLTEQKNVSYQWYKDDVALEGETNSEIRIVVSSIEVEGSYHVIATNEYGSLRSSVARLKVDPTPQPARVVYEGDDPLILQAGEPFTVPMSVFGVEPITYQWYRGLVDPIPGATSRELNLGPATAAHSGIYSLKVKNELQSSPYQGPRVYVIVSEQIFPPKFHHEDKKGRTYIYAEGQQLIAGPGSHAGSLPIDYVWYKDGAPRDDLGSSGSLQIDSLKPEDAGTYYVEARNGIGTEQSGRIILQVTPPMSDALDDPDIRILTDFPKTNPFHYLINQTNETWDGVDALELALQNYSSKELEFEKFEEDTLLTFRWKCSAPIGFEFSYRDPRNKWKELQGDGTWKKETLLIPGQQPLNFRFDPNVESSSSKLWLDAFEIVKSPHVLQQISYDIPRIGGNIILSADILGNDLTYQWYKDDEAIPSETNSSLTIANLAQSDFGKYHLKIENQHGETITSKADLGTNILDTIVQNNLNLAFTGGASTRILAPGLGEAKESLLIKSSDQELWGFETQITGPLTLVMTYSSLGNAYCLLSVDGDAIQVPFPWNVTESYSRFIPSGSHSVKFDLEPSTIPYSGTFFEIKTRSGPLGSIKLSDEHHYNEYNVPVAEYAGASPLTIKWYKDGQLISTKTNVSTGNAYPYNRQTTALDHGEYHFVVTDKNGLIATSEKILFSQMQKLDQVLDRTDGRTGLIDQGYMRAYFDQQQAKSGTASLALAGPFNRLSTSTVRLDVYAPFATFQLRSQDFPANTIIKYFNNGEFLELATNADWQEITAQTEDGLFSLELPEGDEDSTIWIDQLTTSYKSVFIHQPRSITTYIGTRVEFDAEAYFNDAWSNLKLTWFKDGEEVEDEGWNRLPIDSVQLEDLGEYVARATSPEGDNIYSKPATLSLTNKELSSAIGYPGARITTIGNSDWLIDYEDSIDGPSSIISGPLQEDETAKIIIEIDGMSAWGIYSYAFSDHNLDYQEEEKWVFGNAEYDQGKETRKISYSVREYGGDNSKQNRRLRLDGVRATKYADFQYENWINEKTVGILTPSSNSDRASDIDGDGIPNWLEFTLNLDPTSRDEMPKMGLVKSDDMETEVELHFYAARSSDYSISYEASYDLAIWSPVKPSLEIVSSTTDYDEIKAKVSPGSSKSTPFFVRWTIHNRSEKGQRTFSTHTD